MKKILSFILLFGLALTMVGCQSNETQKTKQENNQQSTTISQENVLIAYFSFPETDSVDVSSSASRVIDNQKLLGSTEYVARVIQENTGGRLFQIKTKQAYPGTHEPLVDQASLEQKENKRPELKEHIEDIDKYDVIFVGYPNWWGDMPMSLYSFFEEYDLSGKTIIPFNTHGGSRLSNTVNTIKELQPNATVIEEGLTISRDDVSSSKNEVIEWLNGLGLNIEK